MQGIDRRLVLGEEDAERVGGGHCAASTLWAFRPSSRATTALEELPRISRTMAPEAPARPPESPSGPGSKDPGYSRSARKRHDRPVTPEVAGSSPVAPAIQHRSALGIMKPMSRELPSGTVTFLFTDVDGSTKLLRRRRVRLRVTDPVRAPVHARGGHSAHVWHT